MCGINGIYAFDHRGPPPNRLELIAIRDFMAARGPDGIGFWESGDGRCLLGHRRLAIIDLDDRASQPMQTPDAKLTIAFNGEIYNFRELRAEEEARGTRFRTTSDTEVLLWLYRRHGRDFVSRLRGMFAFAIHDSEKGGVLIGRDHFGIKPLYYADDGQTIRFASQVKALLAGGAIDRGVDEAGLVGFFMLGSVPEPFTWVKKIKALPAGSTLWIDSQGCEQAHQWYAHADVLADALNQPFAGDLTALVRDAVTDSLDAHMVADVDIGLFLSAGIDSGSLLAHLASRSGTMPRTIALGFSEFAGSHEDETPLAGQLATAFGAPHHRRMVTDAEFAADLEAILNAMDQPSIDGVNTWFVAKAAHEAGLKVALSGLGADEILAGYPSFADVPAWHRKLGGWSRIPGMGALFEGAIQLMARGKVASQPKLPGMLRHSGSWEGAWLLKRGLFLPEELSDFLAPDIVRRGIEQLQWESHAGALIAPLLQKGRSADLSIISAFETQYYMRNQLLRDSDWAGMAHSLEIRVPFVDVSLVERLAPALPRFVGGHGKAALAASPAKPLPTAITSRAKSGFAVPTGRWMENLANGQALHEVVPATKGLASRKWAQYVANHVGFEGFAS
jgi:asparagine synthase (glutamine-hydrolysing)